MTTLPQAALPVLAGSSNDLASSLRASGRSSRHAALAVAALVTVLGLALLGSAVRLPWRADGLVGEQVASRQVQHLHAERGMAMQGAALSAAAR